MEICVIIEFRTKFIKCSILVRCRAFGDFKFKWPEETINAAFGGILSKQELAPPNYKTPPYLTATPEVTSHKLTPRDKFLGEC